MTNQNNYYYYDYVNKTIYYSKTYQTYTDKTYLGSSDNPNPKMAASVFLQNNQIQSGFSVKAI
jgi:uncharacterized protein with FMN-binding domain